MITQAKINIKRERERGERESKSRNVAVYEGRAEERSEETNLPSPWIKVPRLVKK